MRETPRTLSVLVPRKRSSQIRQTWGRSAGKTPGGNHGEPQRLNVQSHPEKLEAPMGSGIRLTAEGCFYVGNQPASRKSCQYQVLPEFTVVQHQRDVQLLHDSERFFGCGVVRQNHGDRMAYRVRGWNHLAERLVPFFEKHSLKSRSGSTSRGSKDSAPDQSGKNT